MSLTSYRAAPPRVTRFLPKARYRDGAAVVNAFSGRFFAEGKIPLDAKTSHPRFLESIKAALSGPLVSAGPNACREDCLLRLKHIAFSRPGSDLLSRVLRRSTIGAGAFHGRVRNGNGCGHPAITTRSAKGNVMRSW